jgi:hypothetical protein
MVEGISLKRIMSCCKLKQPRNNMLSARSDGGLRLSIFEAHYQRGAPQVISWRKFVP